MAVNTRQADALPVLAAALESGDYMVVLDSSENTLALRAKSDLDTDVANAVESELQATVVSDAEDARDAAQTAAASIEAVIPLTKTAIVDAAYSNSTSNHVFADLEAAYIWARGEITENGGKVLIRTYHDAGGLPIDPDPTAYSWYSEEPQDSDIRVVSPTWEAQRMDLLFFGTIEEAEMISTLDESQLTTTITEPT